MTFDEFKKSTQDANPPPGLSSLLMALWHDAQGNWGAAHNLAQEVHTKDGALVHAYLHRKEGDLGNASYWYQRADHPVNKKSLAKEWEEIATRLLDQ